MFKSVRPWVKRIHYDLFRKVLISHRPLIRKTSMKENYGTEILGATALWPISYAQIQWRLLLVALYIFLRQRYCYVSTLPIVRLLYQDSLHVPRHLCHLSVFFFAKCAMNQIIWDHDAACWHRTLSCSRLSFFLKTCTIWPGKWHPILVRAVQLTASASAEVVDRELSRHQEEIPINLRHK